MRRARIVVGRVGRGAVLRRRRCRLVCRSVLAAVTAVARVAMAATTVTAPVRLPAVAVAMAAKVHCDHRDAEGQDENR